MLDGNTGQNAVSQAKLFHDNGYEGRQGQWGEGWFAGMKGNLKDEKGKNVTYQEVQKWTVENSKLPDFAFWIDRVHFGTLGAMTVSEREQGRAAGRTCGSSP